MGLCTGWFLTKSSTKEKICLVGQDGEIDERIFFGCMGGGGGGQSGGDNK